MSPGEPRGPGMRPEIAQSWRRSALAGLDPGLSLTRLTHREVDRRSRLVSAATPVLDAIAEHLAGTAFSVVLADREARIVDRRFGERHLRDRFDEVGVRTGRQFTEETSGTNAIATVHELRRGVTVLGEEHYVESLKGLSCYGHPIVHPVTGRLDGILDITCPAEQASPLLAPFLIRSVREIEQLLLEGSREAQQRLMAAFQAAEARRAQPVVVLGEDVVLASPAAMEVLDAADHAVLRGLAADLPAAASAHELTLSSGRRARVRIEPIAGTGGALFRFDPPARAPIPRRPPTDGTAARITRQVARHRTARDRVLVVGEPGTGRTTVTRRLAGDTPMLVLDATDLDAERTNDWERAAASHPGLTVVEELHLLPAAAAVRLARAMQRCAAWVVATCGPLDGLREEHAALAACFPARITLPGLRHRRTELPSLVREFTARVDPGAVVRWTPGALQSLAAHPWPGNLHELRRAVAVVLDRRSAGDVTAADIPPEYRGSSAGRRLAPIEQVEHDAIAAALRACAGNKVHAAERLGMSRSTLYRRIRVLGVRV